MPLKTKYELHFPGRDPVPVHTRHAFLKVACLEGISPLSTQILSYTDKSAMDRQSFSYRI